MIISSINFSKVKSEQTETSDPHDFKKFGLPVKKYMDHVPDSAVCNEAVKLAGKKGFVNLKRVCKWSPS